jgi:hypothetical protein
LRACGVSGAQAESVTASTRATFPSRSIYGRRAPKPNSSRPARPSMADARGRESHSHQNSA